MRLPGAMLWRAAAVAGLVSSGAGAAILAERSWGSVVGYRSPYRFSDGESVVMPPLADRVVLVLVDGLRLDASRSMPGLNRLRARGADFAATAAAPSYSRPGRAVLATGAGAEVHGATSNFHDRSVEVDNLFRSAARSGRRCAVAGSLWRSLFGPDLSSAAYRELRVKDAPGRYAEREPIMRAEAREAVAFAAASRADLTVLDLVLTDYAAHEFGGTSAEYARSVERTDAFLEDLARGLDEPGTVLVVTSDHGHLDEGGHGGPEPEVLAIPVVLAGQGVRAGVRGTARQTDVAPTVAALLGLPLPGAAQGRILVEGLALAEAERAALLQAEWRQKRALARQTAETLGVSPSVPDPGEPPPDAPALTAGLRGLEEGIEAAHEARRTVDRRQRLPILLAIALLPLPLLVALVRRASAAELWGACGGLVVYGLAFRFLVWGRGARLALSAINHEEDVEPYFLWIAVFAAASLAAAAAGAAGLARLMGGGASGRLVEVALALAATLVYGLGVGAAAIHWWQGLFMEWHRVEMRWEFVGFLSLVQLQAVGFASALLPPLAWLVARLGVARAARLGLLVTALPTASVSAEILARPKARPDPAARYLFYLHGRILEEQGRHAVSPQHGPYEYDAILEALESRGFVVVSELRLRGTGPEYARTVAEQVRGLLAAGVPPERITVVGFSKGGFLALAAAAELAEPRVRFVVLAGCGSPQATALGPKLAGRWLSIYDASDDIAGSCRDTFALARGLVSREIVLHVGKGHGTFYTPRKEWLDLVTAWTREEARGTR